MGNKKWQIMIPVALLVGLVGSLPEAGEVGDGGAEAGGVGDGGRGQTQSAGLFSRKNGAGKVGVTQYPRAGRGGEPVIFRQPSSKQEKAAAANGRREITIRKSSAQYAVDFNAARKRWKYLTAEVRKGIDRAKISRNRWEYVVVHNSATAKGSAEIFDRYHRDVRGMANGMAYHFVIGNGTNTGEGEVEIGDRWFQQLDGGHLKSTRQNAVSIGICLVGDFDHERVGEGQLEALDELVDYLRAKVGKVDLKTHREINVVPTTCPGRYFPAKILSE